FQYADVGVNLTMQPRIHGADEVTMHVEIDVSEVDQELNFGGLDQPVIGQRKNTTDLRVRDGEVSLLGGLMSIQNTNSNTGLPGLYSVPILGQLFFGSGHKERDRTELLIAIIPHIVRTPGLRELDMRGIASGTEQVGQLRYAPPA